MAESVGGGGEDVGNGGIDPRVVFAIGGQGVFADKDGKELIVGDCLHFRGHDHAGELVDFFTTGAWVDRGIRIGPVVVLPHEKRVHGEESDLLIGPDVASEEEVRGEGGRGVGEAGRVVGEKVTDFRFRDLESTGAVEGAEFEGALVVGAINIGGVDVGADFIDLLADAFDVVVSGAVQWNGH